MCTTKVIECVFYHRFSTVLVVQFSCNEQEPSVPLQVDSNVSIVAYNIDPDQGNSLFLVVRFLVNVSNHCVLYITRETVV